MLREISSVFVPTALLYAVFWLISQSVWGGLFVALPFAMLMVWAQIFDCRMRRRLQESQRHLATLPCSRCGMLFGPVASERAFNPPPVKGYLIVDTFGHSEVRCLNCNEIHWYHQHRMELVDFTKPANDNQN